MIGSMEFLIQLILVRIEGLQLSFGT